MRQVIERVTCDECGAVFDFEKLNIATREVRIEHLTDWIRSLGWNCRAIEGAGFQTLDTCPACTQITRRLRISEPKK